MKYFKRKLALTIALIFGLTVILPNWTGMQGFVYAENDGSSSYECRWSGDKSYRIVDADSVYSAEEVLKHESPVVFYAGSTLKYDTENYTFRLNTASSDLLGIDANSYYTYITFNCSVWLVKNTSVNMPETTVMFDAYLLPSISPVYEYQYQENVPEDAVNFVKNNITVGNCDPYTNDIYLPVLANNGYGVTNYSISYEPDEYELTIETNSKLRDYYNDIFETCYTYYPNYNSFRIKDNMYPLNLNIYIDNLSSQPSGIRQTVIYKSKEEATVSDNDLPENLRNRVVYSAQDNSFRQTIYTNDNEVELLDQVFVNVADAALRIKNWFRERVNEFGGIDKIIVNSSRVLPSDEEVVLYAEWGYPTLRIVAFDNDGNFIFNADADASNTNLEKYNVTGAYNKEGMILRGYNSSPLMGVLSNEFIELFTEYHSLDEVVELIGLPTEADTSVNLYAQYTPPRVNYIYHLSYDEEIEPVTHAQFVYNGDKKYFLDESQLEAIGLDVKLDKRGYIFAGWQDVNGIEVGKKGAKIDVALEDDVEDPIDLYPSWEPIHTYVFHDEINATEENPDPVIIKNIDVNESFRPSEIVANNNDLLGWSTAYDSRSRELDYTKYETISNTDGGSKVVDLYPLMRDFTLNIYETNDSNGYVMSLPVGGKRNNTLRMLDIRGVAGVNSDYTPILDTYTSIGFSARILDNQTFYIEKDSGTGLAYLENFNPPDGYLAKTNNNTIELIADFDVDFYISFDANGGAFSNGDDEVARYHYDNPIVGLPKISVPNREGYIFRGWSYNPNADEAIDFDNVTFISNSNIPLYAVWELDGHEIVFHENIGSDNERTYTKTVSKNTMRISLEDSLFENNSVTGNFKGWSRKSTESEEKNLFKSGDSVDFYSTDPESVNLYAIWEKYIFRFKLLNSDNYNAFSVWGASDLNAPYYTDSKIKTIAGSVADDSGVIVPQYDEIDFKYKLVSENINYYIEQRDCLNSSDIDLRSIGIEYGSTVDFVPAYDVLYKITYDGNGGYTYHSSEPDNKALSTTISYNVIDPAYSSVVAQKAGYEFIGWSLDPNASVADTWATDKFSNDVTLYAIYQKLDIKTIFNFYGNGGSLKETGEILYQQFVAFGETINLRWNEFKRDLFKFLGWSTNKEGDVLYSDGETISNNNARNDSIDLYALWTPDTEAIKGEILAGNFGTYTLEKSVAYSFGENFKLQNEGLEYSANMDFYVKDEGSYTFEAVSGQ